MATHETHLRQLFAMRQFGFGDAHAALGSDDQRFFAKHRFAGCNGRQYEFFMTGGSGHDQYSLDCRVMDQHLAVVVHGGGL